MLRSLIVLVALTLAACADTAPTQPTAAIPPPGVPVGLTLDVAPVEVPHQGGNVSLSVTVQVQEGTQPARVPVAIQLQLAGVAPITNEFRTDSQGRIREQFYLTRAADFTVRAGAFERHVQVTQAAVAAPPILPGPTCHGAPGPCPPPPPPPAPRPPAPPAPASVSVTLAATPQSALLVDGQAAVAFTAVATPTNGAGSVLGFEWDWEYDGRTFVARNTTGPSGATVHVYTTAGVRAVRVRATTSTGVSGEVSTAVAVTSQAVR